jgi:excinuclease ABC subunit B
VTVPVSFGDKGFDVSEEELPVMIGKLKTEMKQAAKELEFEKAAALRDRIRELTAILVEMGGEA